MECTRCSFRAKADFFYEVVRQRLAPAGAPVNNILIARLGVLCQPDLAPEDIPDFREGLPGAGGSPYRPGLPLVLKKYWRLAVMCDTSGQFFRELTMSEFDQLFGAVGAWN